MRLGKIQLAVLEAAGRGSASIRHHSRGRMAISGVDALYHWEGSEDSLLDRLIELDLVYRGPDGPRPNSAPLLPTGKGWAELGRRGLGHSDHRLQLSRRRLGSSPIAGGGSYWGSRGRCSCGAWKGDSNETPTKGGDDIVRHAHGRHTLEAIR